MRVAHHPIGKLMPFRTKLASEFDLLSDKHDLPREVQVNVRRSAIRTKQRDRVNAVIPTALVAYQLAQKVVSSEARRGLGRWTRASCYLKELVARAVPGEVIEHAVNCRRSVGMKCMSDDFLGRREVIGMRKILVVVKDAAVGTDRAWSAGRMRHARRQGLRQDEFRQAIA